MSFPKATAKIERRGDEISLVIRRNGKFVSATVHETEDKAREAAKRKRVTIEED